MECYFNSTRINTRQVGILKHKFKRVDKNKQVVISVNHFSENDWGREVSIRAFMRGGVTPEGRKSDQLITREFLESFVFYPEGTLDFRQR